MPEVDLTTTEAEVWWLTAETDPPLHGSPPPYVHPDDRTVEPDDESDAS